MKLIKRNGSEAIFNREKIVAAVTKANGAIAESSRISEEDIENIALEVERICLTMVRSAGVEEIQDLVEKEIMKLGGLVTQKGYTLVPLSLYFSGKNVKVEVGLCRGKKLYDKRDSAAEKQANREIDRRIKSQSKYD